MRTGLPHYVADDTGMMGIFFIALARGSGAAAAAA
jgi:hypothetical protein